MIYKNTPAWFSCNLCSSPGMCSVRSHSVVVWLVSHDNQ